ncbi:MAG: aldo/keto reductase [Candidatus Dadabacteria bacterium]|nr:MAG: aldo/keto reductase [Candidatus Dadabacteria bacterium]
MIEEGYLGKSGIKVSRLCFGCWQASKHWSTFKEELFIEAVHCAVDNGINFFDTALAYGQGFSEQVLAKALKGRRDKVVIADKFPYNRASPKEIRKSLEESLRNLNTDYIDLYQQHWPSPTVPLDDSIGELLRLKEEGKIRAVGVSNFMEPEWEKVSKVSQIDTLQPCYNLLWRSIEKWVLPFCIKEKISVIPYSPLCQGLLTYKYRSFNDVPPDVRERNIFFSKERFLEVLRFLNILEEVARKYNRTCGQVALRWLIEQKGVLAPIVGMTKKEQVLENLAVFNFKLAKEDLELLSEKSCGFSENVGPWDTLWNWHPCRS